MNFVSVHYPVCEPVYNIGAGKLHNVIFVQYMYYGILYIIWHTACVNLINNVIT